jgi:hypothetical protein
MRYTEQWISLEDSQSCCQRQRRTLLHTGRRALVLLAGLILASCKPPGEPSRHQTSVPEVDAGPSAVDSGSAPETSSQVGVRLVLPESGDGDTPSTPRPAEILARQRRGEPFSRQALNALTRLPTSASRETADRHHEAGIKHHRRLDIDPAITAYRAALQAWPAHPGANYHLAAALALRSKWDDALYHLRVLATVGGRPASRRLREARLDPDFEPLVDDARFRTLTGYSPVAVAAANRDQAATMAKTLLEANIPADVISHRPENTEQTTLWVSGEDPLAATVAREVAGLLGGKLQRELLRDPPTEHLLVLWVTGDGAKKETRSGFGVIADFIEVSLTAEHDGIAEKLRLWKTGFFQWTRVEPNGAKEERTGRYVLEGAHLSLDFKRVRENIRGSGRTETEQGRRTTLSLKVDGDSLLVDGIRFQPAP